MRANVLLHVISLETFMFSIYRSSICLGCIIMQLQSSQKDTTYSAVWLPGARLVNKTSLKIQSRAFLFFKLRTIGYLWAVRKLPFHTTTNDHRLHNLPPPCKATSEKFPPIHSIGRRPRPDSRRPLFTLSTLLRNPTSRPRTKEE